MFVRSRYIMHLKKENLNLEKNGVNIIDGLNGITMAIKKNSVLHQKFLKDLFLGVYQL